MSHRTQITLTDEQYESLRRESARRGASLAELVRRALVNTYGLRDRSDDRQALDDSFGAWSDRDFDGKTYVDRMRRGMARRLERDDP